MDVDCFYDEQNPSFYSLLLGLCNKDKFPELEVLLLEGIYFINSLTIDSIHNCFLQFKWFEAIKHVDHHSIRIIDICIYCTIFLR